MLLRFRALVTTFVLVAIAVLAFAQPAVALRALAGQPSLASLRTGVPWLAQPKLAKRAKAGGARRDRTADLLHAMQALSQLSYGPVTRL